MNTLQLTAPFVDILRKEVYPVTLEIVDGRIHSIKPATGKLGDFFIMPGFVDAHVHIESSMLVPSEFARLAVRFGTIGTVSDPHEIANVLGIDGVLYMLDNAAQTPFKCCFGAPSCVPATSFETSGAELNAAAVRSLLERPDIYYLSEMMNYPGVLQRHPEVMAKIKAAQQIGKPIDGHAPGLRGKAVQQYIAAGMQTDHECFTLEEALDKIQHGMKILIREGSAAKNFEALVPLFKSHPESVMFCSDDKHPDDLLVGHINDLVVRAVRKGYDVFDVLYAACIHPVKHFNLPIGTLQVGDPADFITVRDLQSFEVLQTYIEGEKVYDHRKVHLPEVSISIINQFKTQTKTPLDFSIAATKAQTVRVIEARNGQLITESSTALLKPKSGILESDIEQDVLKMAVVNRYKDQQPACAFIRNFGLKKGAIASTVAHDSHNIIAIGVTDALLCQAVNGLIESKGGIVVVDADQTVHTLPLPVAGLMSTWDGLQTATAYQKLDALAKKLGCKMDAPFMTLSFMALLVIPQLKLSDLGLFDGNTFQFTDLLVDH